MNFLEVFLNRKFFLNQQLKFINFQLELKKNYYYHGVAKRFFRDKVKIEKFPGQQKKNRTIPANSVKIYTASFSPPDFYSIKLF